MNKSIFLFFVCLSFNLQILAISNDLIYDTIDNGWIEHDPLVTFENLEILSKRYLVKCNKNYMVNSNSSYVVKIYTTEDNTNWMPINDYLVPGLPLCTRICKFQSNLMNGLIEVDSTFKIPKRTKTQNFIELIENSRIEYKCLDGFKMRTLIVDDKEEEKRVYRHYKEKNLEEKCSREDNMFLFKRSNPLAELMFISSMNKPKRSINRKKNKKTEVDDEYEESDEEPDLNDKSDHEENEDDDQSDSSLEELNLNKNRENNLYHECFKNCKAFKNLKLGFVAPLKKSYSPGERVTFLCHQENVIELSLLNPKFTESSKLTNQLHFECSINGTWLLIAESGKNLGQKLNIFRVPKCIPLYFINSRETKKHLGIWPPYLSNADLNLRTFSMMFVIGGFIVAFLIIGILTLKFYRRKRNQLVFRNRSPQSDPLLEPPIRASDNSDQRIPVINSRQNNLNCISTIFPSSMAFGNIGSSSSFSTSNQINLINNSYLPSYEEAIAQPPFNSDFMGINEHLRNVNNVQSVPSHNNFNLIQNNSENLVNQKQIHNLSSENESVTINFAGNSHNQVVRTDSLCSNQTVHSVNPSIRTNNSIATNSSGNSNYGLQPQSLSPSQSTNYRSKRTKIEPNHPKHKFYNQNKNCGSNSAVSESYTVMTSTNSSLLSNQTNASKIPLRGSCNIIDSASTSSSNQSITPNHNQTIENLLVPQNSTQGKI